MLTAVNPKLPMRSHNITYDFYIKKLGFIVLGDPNFKPYLMVQKEGIEIHFFEFRELNPNENYGQVYIRTNAIETLYNSFSENKIAIHPNGDLQIKPWGQKEFSILDPDNNLLTFGQQIK